MSATAKTRLGNFRIAWLWIGGSAVGALAGVTLSGAVFPAPPADPAAWEVIGNRYDLREGAYALMVGSLFAFSQWAVLRYILAAYDLPGKAVSLLWLPITGIGVASIVFLTPSSTLLFSVTGLIIPTLPAIALLSLAQWLLLRSSIKAEISWVLVTVIGAAVAVFAAMMAGLTAGPAGWALMFGSCIGAPQALALMRALTANRKRRESPSVTDHGLGETIAGCGLTLIALAALAPSLMQADFRSVNSVAYSPDGTRIAADVENFVYLWDAETADLLFAVDSGQGQRVWNPGDDMTFSADGSRIAVSSHQGAAIILDSETGERLVTIYDYWTSHGVGSIAFSPDGRLVLLTLVEGIVGLYNAKDGRHLVNFQSSIQKDINSPIVRTAAFSQDSSRVAAGGNYWPRRGPPEGFAAIWDIGAQQELFVLTGHTTSVWHLIFSPDNSLIMTRGSTSVRIWDAHDGEALTALRQDCTAIVKAVFLRGGNHIGVACEDGSIHRCETATSQCSLTFSQPLSAPDVLVSVAFHPNMDQVVTATLAGAVEEWNTRTGKRIRELNLPDPD